MSARKELGRARKAAAQGRGDEALVLLWNLVEQARLEKDDRTLQAIGELAADLARTDESSRQEAERLLETLGAGRSSPRAEPASTEPPPASRGEPAVAEELPPDVWMPRESDPGAAGDLEPVGLDPSPAGPEELDDVETKPRPRSRARYVIPAVTLLAILLNLLARAFGD